VTAFVGGGGKTSAIVRLSNELSAAGWRVVATTTTMVGRSLSTALSTVVTRDPRWQEAAGEALAATGATFVADALDETTGKYSGLRPDDVSRLSARLDPDVVLVEADGSKQRPIKAPAEHEPAMPPDTSLVVPVAGLDALGRPLDEHVAHRLQLVLSICPGDRVTPDLLGRLLGSERGGRKSAPVGAAVVPLLNKSDTLAQRCSNLTSVAARVAASGGFERLAVSDLVNGRFAALLARTAGAGTPGSPPGPRMANE